MESLDVGDAALKEIPHHKQLELCTTRPAYRQGRKLTAVKVYTVTSESQHLYVYGVPKINLRNELKSLFNKYGQILNIHVVPDHKVEIFTECYHIHYQRIQSARIAKRLVDNRSFFGGVLHVCYAPEHETFEETIIKLQQREKDVLTRLFRYNSEDTNKVLLDESLLEKKECQSLHKRKKVENETVSPIYNVGDPILSTNKRLRVDHSNQHMYLYNSQSPNINGGLNDHKTNYCRLRNSKKFIPLPLRGKEVSEGSPIGPVFDPQNLNVSEKSCEVSVEFTSQIKIKKLPQSSSDAKKIVFKNKNVKS